MARTVIGKGSPNKAGTGGVHGSPLGEEEGKLAKTEMGWPVDQEFLVPDAVREVFSKKHQSMRETVSSWQSSFESWTTNPELVPAGRSRKPTSEVNRLKLARFKNDSPVGRMVASEVEHHVLHQRQPFGVWTRASAHNGYAAWV